MDFSSVTLKEGGEYTMVLDNDTARWGRVACGNQYAGGTALYAGVPSPTADGLFRVQWQAGGAAPRLANEDNDTGWSVTQQIQVGEPIGQTFTAISGNPLATISMYIADMNASVAPDDYSLTFELYEGIGTGGRRLGTREYTALTDGFSGFVEMDFSSVTLKEGDEYTVVLDNDTARWGRVACGNQVAGGTALYAGVPSPTADALFRVLWQPDGAAPRLANEDNDTGWSVTQQIQVGEPIGQTFTAISGNPLSTISLYVSDMNAGVAPSDHSLTFELYEGIGTGGRRLGQREYTGPDGRVLGMDHGGLQLGDAEERRRVHRGAGQRHGALGPGGLRQPGCRWNGALCRRAQPDVRWPVPRAVAAGRRRAAAGKRGQRHGLVGDAADPGGRADWPDVHRHLRQSALHDFLVRRRHERERGAG